MSMIFRKSSDADVRADHLRERPPRWAIGGLIAVTAAIALTLGASGCADRERLTRVDPTDASGFTERGWTLYENGRLEDARDDFDAALDLEPGFGPALVGQGWSRLGLANDAIQMSDAVSSFSLAVSAGENGAEVDAGRAAARLGVGGSELPNAISDSQSAQAKDSSFIFEHRQSFDIRDLYLIESFAQARGGDFNAAHEVVRTRFQSPLDPNDPQSWVVDGKSFGTFNAALLAFLHTLSEEHAG